MPKKKLCSPFCFVFAFTASCRVCCRVAEAPQNHVWCSAPQHPDFSWRQEQQRQLALQELWGPRPPSVATTHKSPHCRATSSPRHRHVPITLRHGTRGFGALSVERSCWRRAGTSSWLRGEQLPPNTCQNSPSAAPRGQAARSGCQRAGKGTRARTRPPKIRGLHNSPASRR